MLRVLGQVQNTYIVTEGPEGMYLIDQHAAHERVLFEKVSADGASRSPQIQSLLEPVTVELNLRQNELAESQQEIISVWDSSLKPSASGPTCCAACPAS